MLVPELVLEAVATSAATITVDGPVAPGATLKVYVEPLPEKPLTLAFCVVISDAANPVTDCENFAVTGTEVVVEVALEDVRVTVGPPVAAKASGAMVILRIAITAAETHAALAR